MTKKKAIKKIEETHQRYLNKDQKNLARTIINNLNEKDNIQGYFDFIMKRTGLGFKFDVTPEIAEGRIAVVNEMIDKRINVSDVILEEENKLIIGDNFEALKNLLLTHEGKIDVIYIDPPYNTEASKKDGNDSSKEGKFSKFIYKDKFGRNGWLNMMRDRLWLAKKLLLDKGVIFISIDDSEQAYLKILMDEIFGENNCLASLIVQKKSGGGQAGSYYKGHDHLFAYAKNIKLKKEFFVENSNPQFKRIRIENVDYGYYPDSLRKMHGKFDRNKLKKGEINHRNVFLEDYQISFSKDKQMEIEDKIKRRELVVVPFPKLNANMICKAERWDKIESQKLAYSIITSWTSEGQKVFEEILMSQRGDKDWFDSPKPVSLLKYIIEFNLPQNGIILDFFAGSGTTAQAAMELNSKDKGKRKFILVTNNENNIALNITYERLYRIIKGKSTKGQKNFSWLKIMNLTGVHL